jgi:hypothetical protein
MPIVPLPLGLTPAASSYFAVHNGRVMRAMIRFTPPLSPEQQLNRLDFFRARDELLLWREPPTAADPRGAILGIGLFATAIVAAAHAPAPLRFIVDGKLHVGPSISESGVGVAIGGAL